MAKLNNWRRALFRVVNKNLMVTLVELHDHMWRTNITATLHQSVLYAGVAKRNPLLGEDMKTHLKNRT